MSDMFEIDAAVAFGQVGCDSAVSFESECLGSVDVPWRRTCGRFRYWGGRRGVNASSGVTK